MTSEFVSYVFLMIFLIALISFTFVISKKTRALYELLLVSIGAIISIEVFFFAPNFLSFTVLDPMILLYGLLPVLLMQIAYTMPYKDIIRNIRPIGLLAIVSPIISTSVVGGLFWIGARSLGFDIPPLVALLFGAIMSSTDPVTVLSIFQRIGAPRRLVLLFEWESLFNDGASLALFSLLLFAIEPGHAHTTWLYSLLNGWFHGHTLIISIFSFTSMILGGMILGIFAGICFSKILHQIRKYPYLAILIIVVSAYSAFIGTALIDTYLFPASSVIATIFSTFIIGNYGRYKISIDTEQLAESLFSFAAFIINSLIFLFIGAAIIRINAELFELLLVIVPLSIVSVIVGRAISVYLPMWFANAGQEPSDRIPAGWQHVLAWGSLRGGLALALIAMVPETAKFILLGQTVLLRDFLGLFVIVSVFFSIFVKTLTLEPLIRALGINRRTLPEQIEDEEANLIVITGTLRNVELMYEQKILSLPEKEYLTEAYSIRQKQIRDRYESLVSEASDSHSAFLKLVSLHALALERYFAKELFKRGDMTERSLKHFLAIIDRQSYRLRTGKTQIREIFQESYRNDVFERLARFLGNILNPDRNPHFTTYVVLRARLMILDQTITALHDMKALAEQLSKTEEYDRVEELYRDFYEKARTKRSLFEQEHESDLATWRQTLLGRTLGNLEESVILDLSKKELISDRFLHILRLGDSDF